VKFFFFFKEKNSYWVCGGLVSNAISCQSFLSGGLKFSVLLDCSVYVFLILLRLSFLFAF
jgi:hypothetical protein